MKYVKISSDFHSRETPNSIQLYLKISREHFNSIKSCDVNDYSSVARLLMPATIGQWKLQWKNIFYSAQIVEKVSMKTELCVNQIAANKI